MLYKKMSYSVVGVTLTDGQVKKLRSKSVKQCGTTITLKPSQITSGNHKISLTTRQIKHFNDAMKKQRVIQVNFSAAAIKNMEKIGGIFPLLAEISALISAAASAVGKAAAALGAVGTAAGMALKKATGGSVRGSRHKKGKGFKIARNPVFVVQRKGSKIARNGLIDSSLTLMFNFDLIDAARALSFKNFRGVFMKDQLPTQPNSVETGIINLDDSSGSGTHWVAYAFDQRAIVYFDSYGLAPPSEFIRYIQRRKISDFRPPIFYSTLPSQ